MATELFLILITICAAFVDRREVAPALSFVAIAHIFFFSMSEVSNTLLVLNLSMLAEMLTVGLLVCLRGCVRSNLLKMLLPLSILAIPMHLYGVFLELNKLSLEQYNVLVDVYYAMVILMFLSASKWSNKLIRVITRRVKNGSNIEPINLLREYDNKHKII